MTDPQSQARADLEAWARERIRIAFAPKSRLRAVKEIKRVTIAHVHLPVCAPNTERPDHDRGKSEQH